MPENVALLCTGFYWYIHSWAPLIKGTLISLWKLNALSYICINKGAPERFLAQQSYYSIHMYSNSLLLRKWVNIYNRMQLQSKYLIYNLVNFKVGLLMLYFKYIWLGKMCNIFITGMKRHPYKYKYSRITKTCILLYVSPFLLVIT